jgi:hypothetical protein
MKWRGTVTERKAEIYIKLCSENTMGRSWKTLAHMGIFKSSENKQGMRLWPLGSLRGMEYFKSFTVQQLKDFMKSDIMQPKVPGSHSSCNIVP